MTAVLAASLAVFFPVCGVPSDRLEQSRATRRQCQIAQGVFRIYHPESGWKSIATVIVAGERMLLANDSSCIQEIGVYHGGWQTAV